MCICVYLHMYIYIYMHMGVCMCVWNIWRDVKLLPVAVAVHRFFIFHFFNTYGYCVFQTLVSCQVVSHSRGAQKAHRAVPNEALYGVLRISRLITWTYLHSFWNNFAVNFPTFVSGDRLNPEPACRSFPVLKVCHFYCTVVAICMSHLTFEGSTSNLLHLAMVLAMVTFRYFSGLFTDPFLSGITGVFLHVRCIPHQNSQRLFWASMCLCMDSLSQCECKTPQCISFASFVDTGDVVSVLHFCVVAEVSGSGPGSDGRISGAAQNPRSTQDLLMSWGWISSRDQNFGWLFVIERRMHIYIYIYLFIYLYVIYIYIDYLFELGWWNWYHIGTQKYSGTQNYLWTSWKLRDRCWTL